MSQLSQYLAAILLEQARQKDEEAYGGSAPRIASQLAEKVGGNVQAKDVEDALGLLQQFGAAEVDFSPLTKGYWSIGYDNFRYYFLETEPDPADDAELYALTRGLTEKYPILQAYGRRGGPYVEDAAEHLRNSTSSEWEPLREEDGTEAPSVPASDRLVRLDHNQQSLIEAASDVLIEAVERENSIGGNGDLRQAVIGQLKAGRELIRAQVFRVNLLHQTWLTLLGGLIERYKDQAIAEAAKKLLDLLIEHVFGK